MGKQNVVDSRDRILFSYEKDVSLKHYAKRKKPITKAIHFYYSIHMKSLEQGNMLGRKVNHWLPRTGAEVGGKNGRTE